MYILTKSDEFLCKEIVDASYQVHKELGPGLLEKVYELCFCNELSGRGIAILSQKEVPIVYKGIQLDNNLRLDVLVEDEIICEIKAVDIVNPIWEAQILSHLKISGKHIGFRINFNVILIKNGIRRYCLK